PEADPLGDREFTADEVRRQPKVRERGLTRKWALLVRAGDLELRADGKARSPIGDLAETGGSCRGDHRMQDAVCSNTFAQRPKLGRTRWWKLEGGRQVAKPIAIEDV